MRTAVFAIVCVLSALRGVAQPAIQWQRCYGGDSTDGVYDMWPTRDGGCILSAFALSTDGDLTGLGMAGFYRPWLLKVDSLGNIQWQRRDSNYLYHVRQAIDGGYFLTGARTLKLDSTGAELWNIAEEGEYLDRTFDEGCVITWLDSTDGTYDVIAIKISAVGVVQWRRHQVWIADPGYTPVPRTVYQTADSGYVVMGTDYDIMGQAKRGWITKFSKTRDIEWRKLLIDTLYGLGYVTDGIPLYDGGYLITGFETTRLDDTGGVVWRLPLSARFVRQASDSSLLFCSEAALVSVGLQIKIENRALSGGLLWSKLIGGSNVDAPNAIQPAANGRGIFIGGYTLSDDGDVYGNHGNADAWVVCLRDTGTGGPAAGVQVAQFNDRPVVVYPSPTQGAVHIQLAKSLFSGDHLTVFSSTGQVAAVAVQKSADGYLLDFSGQAPGLYLLTVSKDGYTSTHRIVYQP